MRWLPHTPRRASQSSQTPPNWCIREVGCRFPDDGLPDGGTHLSGPPTMTVRLRALSDEEREELGTEGRVAELVGIRRRGPSPAWLVRSGGEVKLARGLGEALPA